MYVVVAIAVTILVIVLAWRGIGTARNTDEAPTTRQPRPPGGMRSLRPPPTRTIAPDDDPEFLSEIDRRLRGEDKSS